MYVVSGLFAQSNAARAKGCCLSWDFPSLCFECIDLWCEERGREREREKKKVVAIRWWDKKPETEGM